MHSVRSTVERRFESYSGSLFSAMKTDYVVVVEQAHPLGPASLHLLFHGVTHVCYLLVTFSYNIAVY